MVCPRQAIALISLYQGKNAETGRMDCVTIYIKIMAATYLGVLGVALYIGGLPETGGCSDISVPETERRDWTDGYRPLVSR